MLYSMISMMGHTDRSIDTQADRQTDRQMHRQTDRQMHRQTDAQTDAQTNVYTLHSIITTIIGSNQYYASSVPIARRVSRM